MSSTVLAKKPSTQANSSKLVKAESVGMSTERLQLLSAMTKRYIDSGKVPGMVTLVARAGKLVYFEAHGARGLDDPRPLKKDDLFRIYSMSKPVTAVALMQLFEQGHFQLNDPVEKFVPELADLDVMTANGDLVPAESAITMHQLLTHTAGLSYGFMSDDPVDTLYKKSTHFKAQDLDGFVTELGKLPLKFQPGSRWNYSVAVDVMGLIVQRLSGLPFDEYLQKNIFAPLAMHDTFFSVPDEKLERFLPNHYFDVKEEKVVTMGEAATSNYQNVSLFSGGGGLVSTAEDYWRFTNMLRSGGHANGQRIIGPKTLDYMTSDHLPNLREAIGSGESTGQARGFRLGQTFGLGFGIVTDPAAGAVIGSVGEYYWGGAAGTVFWVDPVEDIVVVSMIQLMASPWPLRSDLKTAVYQSLEQIGGATK